jgi:hypothetical protein
MHRRCSGNNMKLNRARSIQSHAGGVSHCQFMTPSRFVGLTWLACLVFAAMVTGNAASPVNALRTSQVDAIKLNLQSEYLPTPARLPTPDGTIEIRSVSMQGQLLPNGSGVGSILFDSRAAILNEFGDVRERIDTPPKPIPVTFRRLTEVPEGLSILRPARDIPEGQNLYALDLPEGAVTGTVRFRLGSNGPGPHRLLLYSGQPARSGRSGEPYVLDLTGEPRVQPRLPDRPWSEQFKLSGTYYAPDGLYRQINIEGTLGGASRLSLDPNRISVTAFGDPYMATLMGFRPQPVTVTLAPAHDPAGLERRLYQVRPEDPAYALVVGKTGVRSGPSYEYRPEDTGNKNRMVLVLGRTETAAHRLLIYEGDTLRFRVPMVLPDRQQHEATLSELDRVTSQEQQAIVSLREMMGYEFTYETVHDKVTQLRFNTSAELSDLDAVLAELVHLEEIQLSGRLSHPGLPSLQKLPKLKNLGFSGVQLQQDATGSLQGLKGLSSLSFSSCQIEPGAMAFLKGLQSLETLNFSYCHGVDDSVLQHVSGLANLRALRLYDEIRPGAESIDRAYPTELGMATLAGLRALESLDIFGEGITDRGLAHLRGLNNLKALHLHHTGVTIPGIIRLAAQSPVTEINASFMEASPEVGGFTVTLDFAGRSAVLSGQIHGQTLEEISGLPNLQRLRIDSLNTATDNDLRHLARAPHARARPGVCTGECGVRDRPCFPQIRAPSQLPTGTWIFTRLYTICRV